MLLHCTHLTLKFLAPCDVGHVGEFEIGSAAEISEKVALLLGLCACGQHGQQEDEEHNSVLGDLHLGGPCHPDVIDPGDCDQLT